MTLNISDYIQKLDQNAVELFSLLDTCSEEEIKIHPENSWSILEVCEHIFLTEKTVISFSFHPIEKKSEKSELFGTEKLRKIIIQLRARKVSAPEFLKPKGLFKSVSEFKNEFTRHRELLKQGLLSERIVIDNSVYPHPYLGEMTRRDWMHFIPTHTERHTYQISDILEILRRS